MDTGPLVALLLLVALAAAAAGWVRRFAVAGVLLALAGLALATLLAAASGRVDSGNGQVTLLVVLAGALAVAGGGPVTSRVFALVDGHGHGDDAGSMNRAGEVLRGGAWIGALERAAIFASLATAQPEGVAIVLGLKGLGRYPELRNEQRTGAAERFIIGTFTSVLWAAACAGVVRLLLF